MKKHLYLIAAAVLAFVACAKEEAYEPEGMITREGKKITIGASFELPTNGTKSDYDAAGNFSWSDDDAIWIGTDVTNKTENWGSGSIMPAEAEVGPGFKRAKFECTIPGELTAVAAVFPKTVMPSYSAGTLSLELPKTIAWTDTQLANPANATMQVDNVMVARFVDIYEYGYAQGTYNGLQFYNVGGLFCLTLKNIPVGADKLIFTADQKINGSFAVSNVVLDDNKNYPQIETTSTETESEKSITITFPSITNGENKMTFFIPVPVGSYVIGFDVQKEDGTSVWKFSASKANGVERGHIVKMPTLSHVVVGGDGDGATNIITTPTAYSGTVHLPSTTNNIYVRMNTTDGTINLAYTDIEGALHPENVYLQALGNINTININLPDSHVELTGEDAVTHVITNVSSYTSFSTLKVDGKVKIGKDDVENSGLTVTGGSLDLQAPTQKVTINIPETAANTTENKVQINITSTIKALAVERAAYTDKAADKIYVKLAPPVSETPTAITVEGINVVEKNCNLWVANGVTVTSVQTQGANTTIEGSVKTLSASGEGTTVVVEKSGSVTESITSSNNATIVIEKRTQTEIVNNEAGEITGNQTTTYDGTITTIDAGSVAIIGTVNYTTLNEAVEKASDGATITIIKEGDYTIPAISKNLTIVGGVEGVEVNHAGQSAVTTITSDKTLTLRNLALNLDKSFYQGFGTISSGANAGALVMENCSIDGSLSLFGVSTFTNCTFTAKNANAGYYNIWAVYSNATFTGCSFTNTNRAVNVYDPACGQTRKTVTFTNCSFTATEKKKAAINIHHNPTPVQASGAKFDVVITDCTTSGTWASSVEDTGEPANATVCNSALWMVSDIENWTNGDITVNGVNVYDAPVAQIGTTTYATLAAAFEAANNTTGATITLLADCETGEYDFTKEALKIESEGTVLDLNGKTITVAKNFTFGVTASNVTIKNGTIASGPNSQKRTNFNSYVLVIGAVASDASISNVTIQNVSTRGGVSVGGSSDAHIKGTATGTVLTNCNVLSGDYYAVCSQNHSVVTIDGGTYTSNQTAVNSGVGQLGLGVLQAYFVGDDGPEGAINVVAGTFNGVINPGNHNLIYISGGTFDHNPPAVCISPGFGATNNGDGTWTVQEFQDVAQIDSKKYETLAAAVEAATSGQTITILNDFTIEGNAGVTIPAGKNITIDLNGKTITNLVTANSASRMIENQGTLTITDSSTGTPGTMTNEISDGIHTGQWTEYNYSTSIIYNTGTLTVEKGTLQQNATSNISYAIDNVGANTSTTINGGNLVAGYIPVRSFNGQNKSVTIHGGTLTGLYALYLQSTTTLTIDGGTFNAPNRNAMYIEGASTVNISGDAVFNYDANRQFVGFNSNSVESGSTVSVTGGTFSSDPTAYVASGYVAIDNNNSTWTVGEGNADRNGYQGQEGQTWN